MECSVLFADVAGSTALYELLGDERAFALVESCLAAMSTCTAQAGGRVVKTIGDAVMAVFGSAESAASAAMAMQSAVDALGPPAGVKLGVRVGFRHGPVVAHEADVFGDTVNLASRLCDLASRGQIITDRDTTERLPGYYRPGLRPLFTIQVKGKEVPVELIELMWQDAGDERTAIVSSPSSADAAHARLLLQLDERELEMGPQRRKVTLGRDHEADFTLRGTLVSRAHASIERRRDRFVLTDHSANGTWVSFDGRPETRVHHEDITLMGQGCIALGQSRAQAAQVVRFICGEA